MLFILGFIIHDCGDLTYFVQRTSGEVARIQREEILSDTDDYIKEIKVNIIIALKVELN